MQNLDAVDIGRARCPVRQRQGRGERDREEPSQHDPLPQYSVGHVQLREV